MFGAGAGSQQGSNVFGAAPAMGGAFGGGSVFGAGTSSQQGSGVFGAAQPRKFGPQAGAAAAPFPPTSAPFGGAQPAFGFGVGGGSQGIGQGGGAPFGASAAAPFSSASVFGGGAKPVAAFGMANDGSVFGQRAQVQPFGGDQQASAAVPLMPSIQPPSAVSNNSGG